MDSVHGAAADGANRDIPSTSGNRSCGNAIINHNHNHNNHNNNNPITTDGADRASMIDGTKLPANHEHLANPVLTKMITAIYRGIVLPGLRLDPEITVALDRLGTVLQGLHFTEQYILETDDKLRNFPREHAESSREIDRKEKAFKALLLLREKITEHHLELSAQAGRLLHQIQQRITEREFAMMKVEPKVGEKMTALLKNADRMPLFVPKYKGEEPPPLCGSIPAPAAYLCSADELVVALFLVRDEDKFKLMWSLAKVIRYKPKSAEYEVEDIDSEQPADTRRHLLPRIKIVPLPKLRAIPQLNPEAILAADADVFALYPRTTVLYPGKIELPPRDARQTYKILFENDHGLSQPVPQQFVIRAKMLREIECKFAGSTTCCRLCLSAA